MKLNLEGKLFNGDLDKNILYIYNIYIMPSKKYYKRKQSRKSHQNKRNRRHRRTRRVRRLKRNKTRRRRAGMLGQLTGWRRSSWNPPPRTTTTKNVLRAKKSTNQLTRKQVEKDLQRMRDQRRKENKSEASEARAQEAVNRYLFNLNWIKQARLAKEKLTEQKIKEIEHFIKTAPNEIHNINKLKQEFEALKQDIKKEKEKETEKELADNLLEEFDKTPSPDLDFLQGEFDT